MNEHFCVSGKPSKQIIPNPSKAHTNTCETIVTTIPALCKYHHLGEEMYFQRDIQGSNLSQKKPHQLIPVAKMKWKGGNTVHQFTQ